MRLIENLATSERSGVIAMFNPYWPDPVFVSSEELERFNAENWTAEELKALEDHRLVTKDGTNSIEGFRESYPIEEELMTLYLILTRNCNLRCSYCFEVERHGVQEYDHEMMSAEVALKAIDIFADEYKRNQHTWNYQVILYGGEPVLNWRVLTCAIERLEELREQEELPSDLRVAINTNGTLVSPERAAYLAAHNVSVAVSLDGDKETHDKYRVDCKGGGSYERALVGYRNLKNANATVCPSVTISPSTVGRTVEIAQELHAQLGFSAVGLNPMMASAEEFDGGVQSYHETVSQDIIECFRWSRELGIAEDRALRKVNSLMSMKPHLADCCAYGQQLVVQPDGSIGICHATSDYNYCTVWDYTSPYATVIAKEWIKRLPLHHEECIDCEAIFVCGGGCAHSAVLLHNDVHALDTGFCVHTRDMLHFLIWDIYDKLDDPDIQPAN